MAETLKYEIAHDLLASQVFERFTAEEQALRKAERLLRDGFEIHRELQDKGEAGRYLTKEEVGYLGPYLGSINPQGELATYLDESMAAIAEEEEAEKRRLQEKIEQQKKEQERQRRLFLYSSVAGVVFLAIAVFAGVQWVAANKAKKEAQTQEEIAKKALQDLTEAQEAQRLSNFRQFYERGLNRMNLGDYSAAMDAFQGALQFDSTNTDVDSLLRICRTKADVAGEYDRHMQQGDQAFGRRDYLGAIQHYLAAVETRLSEQKIREAQIKVDNCINELLPQFRTHVNNAKVFKDAGGCDNARQELRKAQAIQPYLRGKNIREQERTITEVRQACQ